jgi:hypothetical protein
MFEDCGTVDPKIAYHVSLVSILIRLIVGVSPLASQIGSKVVLQDNCGRIMHAAKTHGRRAENIDLQDRAWEIVQDFPVIAKKP